MREWTWESWVLLACFVAVWAYYMAWLVARHWGQGFSNWWQLILAPVLAVVLFIMARRLGRIKKEINKQKRHFN